MIVLLTGQISDGNLAQSLKEEIQEIQRVDRDLAKEAQDRITVDNSLGEEFTVLQANTDSLSELISNEANARQDANTEIINNLNQTSTDLLEERAERIAAIQQEIQDRTDGVLQEAAARVAAIGAERDARILEVGVERDARVDDILTEQGDRGTAISQEKTERVNADGALSQTIETLTSVVGDNTADISTEQVARANQFDSLASSVTTLQTQTGDNEAAIVQETEARTSEYFSMSLVQNVTAAAYQGNSASLTTLEEARVTGEEAVATKLSLLEAGFDDNAASILSESEARSTALTSLANELNVLSAKLDALPTFANDVESATEVSAWEAPTGESFSAETATAYTGSQSGLVTSTQTAPVTGGSPNVVAIQLPSGTANTLASYKVRVTVAIKAPNTNAATEIALGYQAGNGFSGWNRFTPTASWVVAEFTYEISALETVGHHVLVWGDTSGTGKGVLIDRVLVQVAEAAVEGISASLVEEKTARVDSDEALSSRITSLDADFGTAAASVTAESEARATEDLALASQINALSGSVGDNDAAITEEAALRVTAVQSVASDLTALETTVGDNTTSIATESTARSDADGALGQRVDQIVVDVGTNAASITTESTARADADSSMAEEITLLVTSTGANESAIATEAQARSDADGALAEEITTLVTSTENNASSIQQETQSRSDDDSAQGLIQKVIAASTKVSSGINRTREVVRVNDDESLSQRINFLGSQFEDNAAFIQQVQTAYTSADEALAEQLTTLSSEFDDNMATILQDYLTKVDAESASAALETALQSDFNGALATALTEYETASDADNARALLKETLEATMEVKTQTFVQGTNPDSVELNPGALWVNTSLNNQLNRWSGSVWVDVSVVSNAVLFDQTNTPVNGKPGDLWFNGDDELFGWAGRYWERLDMPTLNGMTASVQDNNRAMIGYCMINGSVSTANTPDECSTAGGEWLAAAPLAEATKGVQIVDDNGDTANVEQRMRSYRNELGDLQSEVTLKVQVDPNDGTSMIAGGFGLTADEGTGDVDAGFDVDRFWVGKLGQKTFPFIINGDTGETYIKEAVIQSLTINKLQAEDKSELAFEDGKLKASFIEADNIVTRQMQSSSNVTVGGSTGPAFDFNTDGSFSLRGKDSTGGVIQDTNGTRVYDHNGTLRVKLGKL
jgi:hypothetical protein